MATWPVSLPALPKSGTFTYSPEPNVREFAPDAGRPQRSLLYTAVRTLYDADMDLTEDQAETLVAFFESDCAQGATAFYMADWRGGATRKFTWRTPPQPKHIAGDDWMVSLSFAREAL